MEIKQCPECKVFFPKTTEHFYKKITKAGSIIGRHVLSKDSISLRHKCKKCHCKVAWIKKKAKLMVKYGITSEIAWEQHVLEGKLKNLAKIDPVNQKQAHKLKWIYPYPDNYQELSSNEKERIYVIFRKGYELATYDEEWKKKWLTKHKALRVIDIDDPTERKKQYNQLMRLQLTDAIIANSLGCSKDDVPQWLTDLKRKQLKLYRYVKNKKSENRISNRC